MIYSLTWYIHIQVTINNAVSAPLFCQFTHAHMSSCTLLVEPDISSDERKKRMKKEMTFESSNWGNVPTYVNVQLATVNIVFA